MCELPQAFIEQMQRLLGPALPDFLLSLLLAFDRLQAYSNSIDRYEGGFRYVDGFWNCRNSHRGPECAVDAQGTGCQMVPFHQHIVHRADPVRLLRSR